MKTLDIDECAEFLKVNSMDVCEMVGTGELPGARIGRAWVFLEDDLVDYVRTQIRIQRRERQSAQLEKQRDEGGNPDQDNLAMLTTVLQSRRSSITPSSSRTVNQVA
jgi:excisionase family DNA binding protein